MTAAEKPRLIALDLLRFIACTLVILTQVPLAEQAFAPIQVLAHGGGVGVDLFFVLSGYLVSGLLIKEYQKTGQLNVTRFLIRRGFKIYPAFYFFLFTTVILIMMMASHWGNVQPKFVLPEIFFVQNYFHGVWTHTWSLAVEEHFYLLLGLGLTLLIRYTKHPMSYIPWIFGFLAVFCLCCRLSIGHLEYTARTHLFPTHLRLDAFALGLLLAHLHLNYQTWFEQRIRRLSLFYIVLGIILLIPKFVSPQDKYSYWIAFVLLFNYIGCGSLLIGFLGMNHNIPSFFNLFAYFGERSYSIYLWHRAISTWVLPKICPRLDNIHPDLGWIVSIMLCMVFGVFMAQLIETPSLYLRQKFFPDPLKESA